MSTLCRTSAPASTRVPGPMIESTDTPSDVRRRAQPRPLDLGATVHLRRGPLGHGRQDRPARLVEAERRTVAEERQLRVEVGLGRPQVAPVPIVGHVADRPAVEQAGKETVAVVAEIAALGDELAEHLAERVWPVHEHLGADSSTDRPFRLVGDVGHAVAVGLHDEIAGYVLAAGHQGGHDGRVVPTVEVRDERVAEVEAEELVRAHDDQRIGTERLDDVPVPRQGVGVPVGDRGVVALLERRQDPQATTRSVEVPRPATGEVLVEQVRLVLLEDPHVDQAAGVAFDSGTSISR